MAPGILPVTIRACGKPPVKVGMSNTRASLKASVKIGDMAASQA
jgi:hypothetical protein